MSGCQTEQHRLVHRGRSFHFVSYEGHPADATHQQSEMPPTWYLMLFDKRWVVSPQVGETAPVELDRQFGEWLSAEHEVYRPPESDGSLGTVGIQGSGFHGQILVAMHLVRRPASLVDGLPLTQHLSLHLGRVGTKRLGSAPAAS